MVAAARRRGLPPMLLALLAIATTDLVFASTGLAIVLGFIGVKLVLEFFDLHIPTGVSLGVIALVLAITTTASLARARGEPRRRAHAGALRSKPKPGVE